jgi:hypothetical protein
VPRMWEENLCVEPEVRVRAEFARKRLGEEEVSFKRYRCTPCKL